MESVKLLGISASPRDGNTAFLVRRALDCAKKMGLPVTPVFYSFQGKKFGSCLGCFSCTRRNGECTIKDDFTKLRSLWLDADAIIYGLPVYHMSYPAQFKAFIDRLGQTLNALYAVRSMRHLKVVGCLVQGAHPYGGQELALLQTLAHVVLLNSIPVAGDGWESYIGAAGWTGGSTDVSGFRKKLEGGEELAGVTIRAAESLARRVVEVAHIVKAGILGLKDYLAQDPRYGLCLARMVQPKPADNMGGG